MMKKRFWIVLVILCAMGLALFLIFGGNKTSAVGPSAMEGTDSAEIQKLEAEFKDLRQQANATLDLAQKALIDSFEREISSADGQRLGSLLIRETWFGHLDKMKLLIQKGANVNVEESGETPLLKAIKTNQPQAVLLLLEAGANVNQPAKNGNNPLQTAVDYGQVEIVQLFLKQPDIQINQTDSGGNTVLMEAAKAGQLEMVQALVAAGAEVGIKNQRGLTALDMAKAKRHKDVMEFLTLSKGAAPSEM